jgi:hypothetical protein
VKVVARQLGRKRRRPSRRDRPWSSGSAGPRPRAYSSRFSRVHETEARSVPSSAWTQPGARVTQARGSACTSS